MNLENQSASSAGYIVTYTGRKFYALDPNPADIDIRDIAHGLAMTCRFGGQTQQFYSVAEHSVIVARNCPENLRMAGLLHDAAEAYIGDIPKPFKAEISNYREIEDNILRVIYRKFGVNEVTTPVKHVDDYALHSEAAMLIPQCPWLDLKKVRKEYQVACLGPAQAELLFLQVFNSLYAGIK